MISFNLKEINYLFFLKHNWQTNCSLVVQVDTQYTNNKETANKKKTIQQFKTSFFLKILSFL